jgi:hypothetical protein
MKSRLMRALSWAVFPALLVGGFALAAPDNSGNGSSAGSSAGNQDFTLPVPPPAAVQAAKRRGVVGFAAGVPAGGTTAAGPGPLMIMGGPDGGDITYSEIHVLQNGEPVVLRDDRGKIDSVSSDSITITENDDSSVTIPVDSNTKVLIPPTDPGQAPDTSTVDDLKAGQDVTVHRQEGHAADFIGVITDDGGRPFIPLPPPPPGRSLINN